MALPTRYKGSAAYLSVGLTEASQVPISGVALGLDAINLNEVEDQRDVPGGGTTTTKQALGYKEGTSSFTVDENEHTAPVFHGKNGRRFYCTYGPEGTARGMPKLTFQAIGTITHMIEERGVRRFNVELAHDGLIDRSGTFS